MSAIRASGAIPAITALQMATASLAVPKSVIKTMVGLRGVAWTNSLGAGGEAQPAKIATTSREKNARRRDKSDIEAPFLIYHTSISGSRSKRRIKRRRRIEWELLNDSSKL